MKIWTSLTDLGCSQFWTLFTFLSLMVTPLVLTMYPKNSTSSWWNTDFFNETAKSCCSIRSRTYWTQLMWSSILSGYVRISSKYTTTPWSKNSLRILFIIVWKVAGAMTSPKDMTLYSYCPYHVRKAVLCSSPFLIRIRSYPSFKLSFVNTFALATRSCSSSMTGRGYLFRIVNLLRFL